MRKALFLDRDGVINEDKGYVHTPQDFVFIDGIFDFCRTAASKGYAIIVITNQSGIERGIFSEDDFRLTTTYMFKAFRQQGIQITDVFHCPNLTGEDRKPNPGMFLKAQSKWDVDMAASISIGDRERDIQAGNAAGVGQNELFKGSFEELKRLL